MDNVNENFYHNASSVFLSSAQSCLLSTQTSIILVLSLSPLSVFFSGLKTSRLSHLILR